MAKTVDQLLPKGMSRPGDPDAMVWWEVCLRKRNEEELGAAKRRLFRLVREAGGSVGRSRLQFYLKEVFVPVQASVNMLNAEGVLDDAVSISVMPMVTVPRSRPNPLEVAEAMSFVENLEGLVRAGWNVKFGLDDGGPYVRLCGCEWADDDPRVEMAADDYGDRDRDFVGPYADGLKKALEFSMGVGIMPISG